MDIIYCDASQHEKYEYIGVGIFHNGEQIEVEIPKQNHKAMLHEIEAIIKVIEYAFSQGLKHFKIVNDEKVLITSTRKRLQGEKVRCKGLLSKERYVQMMVMLRKYNIQLDYPKSEEDKEAIRICHRLSRNYISRNGLK